MSQDVIVSDIPCVCHKSITEVWELDDTYIVGTCGNGCLPVLVGIIPIHKIVSGNGESLIRTVNGSLNSVSSVYHNNISDEPGCGWWRMH